MGRGRGKHVRACSKWQQAMLRLPHLALDLLLLPDGLLYDRDARLWVQRTVWRVQTTPWHWQASSMALCTLSHSACCCECCTLHAPKHRPCHNSCRAPLTESRYQAGGMVATRRRCFPARALGGRRGAPACAARRAAAPALRARRRLLLLALWRWHRWMLRRFCDLVMSLAAGPRK